MRFMIMIKANADTEAGVMPSEQLLADMTRFNEELVEAGVMQGGEGLHPTSNGARVQFDGEQRSEKRGPFENTGQIVCGFWLWKLDSLDEAIAWAKRIPNPTGQKGEVEIRQVFDACDFGEEFTPELREREEKMRERLAEKADA